VKAICAVDPVAEAEEERRDFIRSSAEDGTAWVAVADGRIVGYAVLEHTFFARGFVAMLMVDPRHRRRGVGSALMRHLEDLCESERIFVSTNESNLPMQALVDRLGYKRSGKVEDLDPGDPEIFYSKRLR
jgi:ribosomal protein S18 acetylase RimI-like enzyme